MKDSQLRGRILQELYDRRREGNLVLHGTEFGEDIEPSVAFQILDQLEQKRLIDWKPLRSAMRGSRPVVLAHTQINAFGIDVVEGGREPPISITFHMNQANNFENCSNFQIGNHNTQNIEFGIKELIEILNSTIESKEKREAKSRLLSFLSHPLTSSILGASATVLAGMIQ